MLLKDPHLQVLAIYGLVCIIVAGISACSKVLYASYQNNGPKIRQFSQQADLVLFTAAWYALSVTLTLFNKWFYTLWEGGFDLPLSATACHMVVKAILAQFLISSPYSPLKENPIELSLKETSLIVAPIGLATAGDIVLSNFSFLYITVTLYTILKSASLLWILLWGVLFQLEKCSLKLSLVCGAVSIGLALASYGDTNISIIGACLVLFAGCLGGLRWALSQRLISLYHEFRSSSLHLVAKIAPWSALSSVIGALMFDGTRIYHIIKHGWQSNVSDQESSSSSSLEDQEQQSVHDSASHLLTGAFGFILFGGIASFLLLLVEVKLLQLTSSLTVGVLGTVKEILQIILAVIIFSDKLSIYNVCGLILCIMGTLAYQRIKSIENASQSVYSSEDHEYDPVKQADVELECFLNTVDDVPSDDDELSDGWDDMS